MIQISPVEALASGTTVSVALAWYLNRLTTPDLKDLFLASSAFSASVLLFAIVWGLGEGCLFTCDTGDYSWREYLSDVTVLATLFILCSPVIVGLAYLRKTLLLR
jgi:hypothetical protein